MDLRASEVKEALEAGMELGDTKWADGEDSTPYVVVPAGARIESMEKLLPMPRRIRQHPKFREVGSFVAYVNAFKTEHSRIFVEFSETGGAFMAILDYHAPDEPAWCEHRATYDCPATVEWKRWCQNNRKEMPQQTFAEFLEENLTAIVDPPGAAVLEIARKLVAKTTVDFVSAVRLENGNEQFVYEERTEAKAGEKGQLTVPSELKLGVKLFQGGDTYELKARLRYRLREKKLVFWYELVNPHLVVEDALGQLLTQIGAATKIEPLAGTC
jgi:uncharacterized protein YfdQ (DUF2303 family)